MLTCSSVSSLGVIRWTANEEEEAEEREEEDGTEKEEEVNGREEDAVSKAGADNEKGTSSVFRSILRFFSLLGLGCGSCVSMAMSFRFVRAWAGERSCFSRFFWRRKLSLDCFMLVGRVAIDMSDVVVACVTSSSRRPFPLAVRQLVRDTRKKLPGSNFLCGVFPPGPPGSRSSRTLPVHRPPATRFRVLHVFLFAKFILPFFSKFQKIAFFFLTYHIIIQRDGEERRKHSSCLALWGRERPLVNHFISSYSVFVCIWYLSAFFLPLNEKASVELLLFLSNLTWIIDISVENRPFKWILTSAYHH